MLTGIIKRFDASKNVTLNIINGTTVTGGPGQYQGAGFVNNMFQANITLSTAMMSGSSKEFAISVLIHEFIHAYIHTSGNPILQSDHNTMSNNYITPMASYLTQYFGIDIKDAYALSWYGVGDSNVFNPSTPSNTEYTMSNGLKITKSEILNIGLAYSTNQIYAEDEIKRGVAICN